MRDSSGRDRLCRAPLAGRDSGIRRRLLAWNRPARGKVLADGSILVNDVGVEKARELIDARRYRLRSRWADVQPRAADQNVYLKAHGWDEYAT